MFAFTEEITTFRSGGQIFLFLGKAKTAASNIMKKDEMNDRKIFCFTIAQFLWHEV